MKPREIIIIPVLNGFLVQIGCQKVVVNSIRDLTEGIRDYYANPAETEKRWISNKLNDTLECPAGQPEQYLTQAPTCNAVPEREFSATERLLRR